MRLFGFINQTFYFFQFHFCQLFIMFQTRSAVFIFHFWGFLSFWIGYFETRFFWLNGRNRLDLSLNPNFIFRLTFQMIWADRSLALRNYVLITMNFFNFIVKSLLLLQIPEFIIISLFLEILCAIFLLEQLLPQLTNFFHNVQRTKFRILCYDRRSCFLDENHIRRQTFLRFFQIWRIALKLPNLFIVSFLICD